MIALKILGIIAAVAVIGYKAFEYLAMRQRMKRHVDDALEANARDRAILESAGPTPGRD